MGLFDFLDPDPNLVADFMGGVRSRQRQQDAFKAQMPDQATQDKFMFERRARGIPDWLLGAFDIGNQYLNAGIRDVDYATSGGLSGGTYDPYQLPMPSQSLANVASSGVQQLTGQEPIDPQTMPPALQKRGELERGLMGMMPGGVGGGAGALGKEALFIGTGAKLTAQEADDLARAQQMLKRGAYPTDVWTDTGWGKVPFGKGAKPMMMEIDDSAMKWQPGVEAYLKKGGELNGKLSFFLDHPELFRAYPELADLEIRGMKLGPKYSGAANFGPSGAYIRGTAIDTGRDKEKGLLALMGHEIQHHIQYLEPGWPRGSTTKAGKHVTEATQSRIDEYKLLQKEARGLYKSWNAHSMLNPYSNDAMDSFRHWRAVNDRMADLEAKIRYDKGWDFYERQPGEVLARNVENRMAFDQARRRISPPDYTQDFPASEQKKVYNRPGGVLSYIKSFFKGGEEEP